MKTTVNMAAAILVGIALSAVAQGQPQPNCVKDVTFGKEFLAKFPDAGVACREVKVVGGEKWVRFGAEVKTNKDSRITLDFLNSQGDHAVYPMTFLYTPDATLTLENNKVKAASAVEKGDKIVVWIPESRFGLYAQPGVAESKQFRLASDDSTIQR